MKQLEKLNFKEETLVAFFLGGKVEGINIEAHDVRFLIGRKPNDFLDQIKKSWIGTPDSLHVDSWLPLRFVNNFKIQITKEYIQNEQKLYFINLGFYKRHQFGENHSMKFIVAKSKQEAKQKAIILVENEIDLLHLDNQYDIDDCIQIESNNDFSINIIPHSDYIKEKSENGWMKVIKD